jgi:hypothetical protein
MVVVDSIKEVTEQVIHALPPGFIALLSINTLFLLALLWFMHDIAVTRIEAVVKLFDACTKVMLH